MELILISESKLKVMLTADDMEAYSLTCDNIDYDNTETRKAFWNILDEAKHRTGFDAAKEKVFIQIFPSKGGGCEMYVTKLEGLSTTDRITCHVKRDELICFTDIYAFLCLDDLLNVCAQLDKLGFKGESSAYAGDDGKFYLVISDTRTLGSSMPTYPFIAEYGEKKTGKNFILYIKEHCKLICKGEAVEKLCVLA